MATFDTFYRVFLGVNNIVNLVSKNLENGEYVTISQSRYTNRYWFLIDLRIPSVGSILLMNRASVVTKVGGDMNVENDAVEFHANNYSMTITSKRTVSIDLIYI